MRLKTAMTKNIRRFLGAVDDLINRPQGTEGMGLLWGHPGEGKTTALAYVVNAVNTGYGGYVRAMSSWTVTSMLGKICEEMGGHRKLRRADMIDFIAERLADSKIKALFIDEADHLFDKPRKFDMAESLRDIYDVSGVPIVLCGMENIARTVQTHGRFARRITQWIEFTGIDLADARTLADTVCEVSIEPCLLQHLHEEARGNIGRMVIGLTKIERMARTSGLLRVNAEQWGRRPLFYDQPVFSGKGAGRG